MKRFLISLGALAVAAFSLTNCTKDVDQQINEAEGMPYTIYANSADTKTVNDGLSTKWAEGDALNVFHAEAGLGVYSENSKFTLVDAASGKFTTDALNGELAEVNDWYVLYPYLEYATTPSRSAYTPIGSSAKGEQTQTGNNSTTHIAGKNYPMWGIAEGQNSQNVPNITMTHLSSLIEVVVTNSTSEDLTVTSVSFTAEEDIVGTYYIDFSTDTPKFTGSGTNYVSKTANLKVVDGEAIAQNAIGKFYFAIKPFTATAGQALKISVNGYEKTLDLTKDVTFTPGKIKKLNFSYDKVAEPAEILTFKQVTDLSEIVPGEYIIVNGNYYLPSTATSTAPSATDLGSVIFTDGVYEGVVPNNAIWTFAGTKDAMTIKNANNDNLYSTNANNGIRVGNIQDTWSFAEYISKSNISGFSMQSNSSKRFCAVYTDGPNWRSYTTRDANNYKTKDGVLYLYKKYDPNAPVIPVISVPETTIDLPATAVDATVFNVTVVDGDVANVKMIKNTEATWLTASFVDGVVTYSATENTDTENARTATLTFSIEGGDDVVVTITQAKAIAEGSAPDPKKYTFADYTAGEQYAEGEVHKLDEYLTITTTECHFTSELRIYSSSTHDGFAIGQSTYNIASLVLNAGNKADTLNVYGSTDGITWSLIKGVATTSSYTDYTVDFGDTAYKYFKLDVAGTQQVRLKYIEVTYKN